MNPGLKFYNCSLLLRIGIFFSSSLTFLLLCGGLANESILLKGETRVSNWKKTLECSWDGVEHSQLTISEVGGVNTNQSDLCEGTQYGVFLYGHLSTELWTLFKRHSVNKWEWVFSYWTSCILFSLISLDQILLVLSEIFVCINIYIYIFALV